ncbi:MAG: cation:proton antiporter [Chloroflexi bacterium]|nr:cation:proton antiporter [Chloroflexota bacterium]
MAHETALIANITLAFLLAFFFGFLASRLHLPPLIGYLLAGVAIGPFTPGFVADVNLAGQLAEIGVILLMFGVGIHFSLRDLLAVRAIAIAGAVGQSAVATALGTLLTLAWGWSVSAGVVFGLALSVASTVVLLRALMDRHALESVHGKVAVGWLIVEDLFTVIALVILPALAAGAGGQTASTLATEWFGDNVALALLFTLGKVAVFALLMLFVGARLVPWLLVQVARTGSRELFTLGVLAVALGVAFGAATVFGVSLALGAFIAGVVVGESDLSHQAAADALPLRDAFSVLFFVSVGMLFDPSFVLSSPGQALAVLLVILVAKPLVAFLIVFAFGYPIRTGLTVAAGLAQIGEFSFILAALGLQLALLPREGYDLIISGALFSIVLNPLLFNAIEPVEAWLRQQPWLAAFLDRRAGKLAKLPPDADEQQLRGHAVICGYGRVGSVIGQALERRGFRYVVVEQNRQLVEHLRQRGILALWGDASNSVLLERLNLPRARILLVAIPDPAATRQIVDYARQTAPRLDIIARTHSEQEWTYLQRHVREALLGERELAIEMAGYALRRFGVSAMETLAIMQGLRRQGRGSLPAPASHVGES